MKIYAARHGSSKMNEGGYLNGIFNTEDPLTPKGSEQAASVVSRLPSDLDHIFSSDLLRARQTAGIINDILRLPITYHLELREINYGAFGGRALKEVKIEIGEAAWNKYRRQEYDFRPWGGESANDVKCRLNIFLQIAKRGAPTRRVLVVTSSGIIKLMHKVFSEVTVEHINNASLHEFDI